jgi:hypothetical protein
VGAPDVSVLVDLEGWPDDTARFLASLARHRGERTVEVVAVDRRGEAEPPSPALFEAAHAGGEGPAASAGPAPAWNGPATYLVAPPGTGFGAALNLALGAATGAVVVLVDTSLELTGDLLGDLLSALDDPAVAVAGPYGLATDDLCDYEERTAGDVAAVQGYCLAARRADLSAAGGVQAHFHWYRNADIDVSLRLRTLREPPVRRAVAVGAEHCTRHVHRAWEATPEAERGERSRHNMGLMHEVFFGRKDLTA